MLPIFIKGSRIIALHTCRIYVEPSWVIIYVCRYFGTHFLALLIILNSLESTETSLLASKVI